jgi:hypothetical protein
MTSPNEFRIEIFFDKRDDGRFHVHSPSVPGLYLAGADLDALRADVEPIVKDLLWFNKKIIVDSVRWVPSLDDIVNTLKAPAGKETFVVTVKDAA